MWGVGVGLHSFLTSTLDAGEWSTSGPVPLALPNPRKGTTVPIEQEVGWTTELVWSVLRRERFLLPGYEP